MSAIELNRVNLFCLRKQHLTDDSKIDDIVQITPDIGGLHTTSPTTPYLSLFSRSANFARKDLEEELYVKRTLGKLRSARKTVYILPKEMLPIAFSAIKSMLNIRYEGYIKYLGISRKEYKEISKSILTVLQDKGMTTKEIKKTLGTKLNISAIVNLMCDQGLLIRGKPKQGWKSNIHTYYPFQKYFPDLDLNEMDETTAKELLIKKYIASFGPVTGNDISWWTGFTKRESGKIMQRFQDEIISIEISDLNGKYIMLSADEKALKSIQLPQKPVVNLLPVLDSYLMGYKERERYLSPKNYDFIYDRSGNATSTILVDGRIVGVWDFLEDKKPKVKLYLFEDIERSILEEIYSGAFRIGEFIADKEVIIKECDSMVSLKQRTMGGFMSPLKNC